MKLFVEDKQFEFDVDELDNFDYMDIEDVTGLAATDFFDSITKGSGRALTALVWIMRRKEEPGLEFKNVRFRLSALKLELNEDEQGKADGGTDSGAESATS
jgi:hypothetical protein